MSKLSLFATLTSIFKDNRIYNSAVTIGELLFCELEPENLFNDHRNAVKIVKGSGNKNQIIWHFPELLTEKIAPLIRQDSFSTIRS